MSYSDSPDIEPSRRVRNRCYKHRASLSQLSFLLSLMIFSRDCDATRDDQFFGYWLSNLCLLVISIAYHNLPIDKQRKTLRTVLSITHYLDVVSMLPIALFQDQPSLFSLYGQRNGEKIYFAALIYFSPLSRCIFYSTKRFHLYFDTHHLIHHRILRDTSSNSIHIPHLWTLLLQSEHIPLRYFLGINISEISLESAVSYCFSQKFVKITARDAPNAEPSF